jgi:hypothetical protein
MAGCDSDPTYGEEFQGDSSKCISVKPDISIQIIGGDIGGLQQKFGAETNGYSGHAGCDSAFVIDYLMPDRIDNTNPGWSWAWIHVASRLDPIDEGLSNTLWTSMQVYAYWEFQGVRHQELEFETYHKGQWTGSHSEFGFPENRGLSSRWDRIRVVSQHGGGLIAPATL